MGLSENEKVVRKMTDEEIRSLRRNGYRILRTAHFDGAELPFVDFGVGLSQMREGLNVIGREMGRRGL